MASAPTSSNSYDFITRPVAMTFHSNRMATLLMLAAIDGKSEIVRLLLEQYKAGLDEKDPVRFDMYEFPPKKKKKNINKYIW